MEEENKKMFDDDDFFDSQKNNKKAKAKLVDKTSTNETSPSDKISTKTGNKAKKDKSGVSSNVRPLFEFINPSFVTNFIFY
jgi:aconitase A